MRRAAAAVLTLMPALVSALPCAAVAAPLSIENARPMAIPPPPRLKTPALPPAPQPLQTPDLMAVPESPHLTTPAPVAAPAGPVGAPPPPTRRAEPPPVAAPQAQPAAQAALTPPPVAPLPAIQASIPGFAAGSSVLPDAAEAILTATAEQMRAAPGRRLQLRAYAAGDVDSERQARQLSLARALAVRERLTALGVRSTRIDVRPLGRGTPPGDSGDVDRVDLEFTSE